MAALAWAEHGVVVRPGLVDGPTVERLRGHHAALLAAAPHAAASGLLATVPGQDPIVDALADDPRLVAAAEGALGPGARATSACWVTKGAGAGRPASWHQDGPAWPTDPERVATLWLALDDADGRNGCLRVVPGSHRRGPLPHDRDDARLADELFPVAVAPSERRAAEAAAVDLVLRAGDASVHHALLLHASGPNRSQRPRRALVVRFALPPGGPGEPAG